IHSRNRLKIHLKTHLEKLMKKRLMKKNLRKMKMKWMTRKRMLHFKMFPFICRLKYKKKSNRVEKDVHAVFLSCKNVIYLSVCNKTVHLIIFRFFTNKIITAYS